LSGLALTLEILLPLFLRPLLFEAAFHPSLVEFKRNQAHILFLAIPGVMIAAAVTAGLTWLGLDATGIVPGMGWAPSLIFADVIVSTDPISVLVIFTELGVPRRL
jgi:CPA1 family monovalent cation:H+ antiporter